MSEIKSTYPLIKAENKEMFDDLFINSLLPKMSHDKHLSDTFLKIIDELLILKISNGKIFKDENAIKINKELQTHSLLTVDLTGMIRSTKVIKKLDSAKNSYEIRINYEHEKHRVLIFPVDLNLKGLTSPFVTFSYGFTKIDGIDGTQVLLESSQRLRDKIYNHTICYDQYYTLEE